MVREERVGGMMEGGRREEGGMEGGSEGERGRVWRGSESMFRDCQGILVGNNIQ